MRNTKKFLIYFLIEITAIILLIGLIISGNKTPSERSFAEFVSWMRNHGYSERIIDIYECNYRDPLLKLIIDDHLRIRKDPNKQTIACKKFKNLKNLYLVFIEVVPTDKDVSFYEVDPDVLKEVDKYLEERFGKNIIINHKKIDLNYNETFGDIFYSYDSLFKPKTNPNLVSFMKQFEPPCIIRFDAEVINGKEVPAIWEIRHCAIMTGKEYRLIKDIRIFDKYAHEFGHNVGLIYHQFVDPRNPTRKDVDLGLLIKNEGRYVGVDDIMIKSKEAENKEVGHYVSPLSRYVLEPVEGYEDDDEFGMVYNNLYSPETLEKIKRQACGR